MASVDELVQAINTNFPDMLAHTGRDVNQAGNAWFNLPAGHMIEVRTDKGYGLYLTDNIDAFGVGPDETYQDTDTLMQRLKELES